MPDELKVKLKQLERQLLDAANAIERYTGPKSELEYPANVHCALGVLSLVNDSIENFELDACEYLAENPND